MGTAWEIGYRLKTSKCAIPNLQPVTFITARISFPGFFFNSCKLRIKIYSLPADKDHEQLENGILPDGSSLKP
jgi:hypothetical protein